MTADLLKRTLDHLKEAVLVCRQLPTGGMAVVVANQPVYNEFIHVAENESIEIKPNGPVPAELAEAVETGLQIHHQGFSMALVVVEKKFYALRVVEEDDLLFAYFRSPSDAFGMGNWQTVAENWWHKTHCGVSCVDLSTHQYIFTNAQTARLLGYEPDAFRAIGPDPLGALVHPADLPLLKQARSWAEQPAAAGKVLIRYLAATGEYRWLQSAGERMVLGGRNCIVVTNTEVSKHMQDVEALQRANAFQAALLDSGRWSVFAVDREGKLLFYNKRFEGYIDQMSDGYLQKGMGIEEISNLSQLPLEQIFRMEQALSTQKFLHLELPFTDARGEERWAELHASKVHMDGQREGVVFRLQEITTRRKSEQELLLFRKLVDLYEDMVLVLSESGVVLYANQRGQLLAKSAGSLQRAGSLNLFFLEHITWPKLLEQELISNNIVRKNGYQTLQNGETFFAESYLTKITLGENTFITLLLRDASEQKKAEEDLHRSQGYLSALVSSLDDAVFIMDEQGCYIDLMSSKVGTTIFDRDIYKGRSIFELFDPGFANAFMDVVRQVIRTRSSQHYVYQVPESNRIFNARITFISVPSDDPTEQSQEMVSVLVSDITQKVENERALRDAKANFESILNNTKDFIWYLDREYKVITLNNAFREVYQKLYKKDPKPGTKILGLTGNESLMEKWRSRYDRAFEGESFSDVEVIPVGSEQYVYDVSFNPIRGSYGQVIGCSVFARDLTERKRVEVAVLRSEASLRGILESVPQMILTLDQELKIVQMNSRLMKGLMLLTGLKPEVGEPILERLPEKVLSRWQIIYADVSRGQVSQLQHKFVMHGREFILETYAAPIEVGGIVNAYLITISDVTEKYKAQREISLQNEELRKVNSELDRFVYSVSHDLRAPLTSSMGLVNLLKEETSEQLRQEYLFLLNKSLKRLDTFILDIIALSRNARTEVLHEPIDFQEILDEVWESQAYQENAARIDRRSIIRLPRPFHSDPRRLHIILNNLISNAIRYANLYQSIPFVEIRVSESSEAVLIEVEDNGTGIPAEHLDKIFGMFYRAHSNKTGSGLGLYIVKETIEKLKGSIRVVSEVNKGTTFVILLPRF